MAFCFLVVRCFLLFCFKNNCLNKNGRYCRLINLEDLIKASVEQLVQEMSDHDKAYLLFDSMSGDDKAILVRAVTYHSFLFPFPPSIIYSLLRFNLANPPFSI